MNDDGRHLQPRFRLVRQWRPFAPKISIARNADTFDVIETLGALAQTTRLATIRHLMTEHPESLPAGEIARRCGVPHNTLWTSLFASLIRVGLIAVERQGRTMNYRADIGRFRDLIRFLTRDCCNGRPDLCGDLARMIPDDIEDIEETTMTAAFNVLFMCTRNSARSIVAEAMLEKTATGGSTPIRRARIQRTRRWRRSSTD